MRLIVLNRVPYLSALDAIVLCQVNATLTLSKNGRYFIFILFCLPFICIYHIITKNGEVSVFTSGLLVPCLDVCIG